jgi:hypothetical protein
LKFNFLKFDLFLEKNGKSNFISVLLNVGETTDVGYGKKLFLITFIKTLQTFSKEHVT